MRQDVHQHPWTEPLVAALVDQVVHGSDRPVVEPTPCPLGDAVGNALVVDNPARLLAGAGQAVAA